MDWTSLFMTFVSVRLGLSLRAACRAVRPRRNLAWASAPGVSRCSGFVRPAVSNQTRSVATSRRRYPDSIVIGWCKVRTADFTLRGRVAELAERGLKDYRTVWDFVVRHCSPWSITSIRS